ncbi:MAG: hypothetical protein ACXU86_09995, partial [Archangium sp.]
MTWPGGVASAATEALSTSELRRGAVSMKYDAQKGQLPPPYQRALDEVERAEMARAFSPGSVALGSFDALTMGVPLGFYNLLWGQAARLQMPELGLEGLTEVADRLMERLGGAGLGELARYIQANREAALLVHLLQHDVAPDERRVRMGDRVVGAGGGDDRREHRR